MSFGGRAAEKPSQFESTKRRQGSLYIEQAVFTSAQTGRSDGYQLVAKSAGVSDEDARTLAIWGPSHDALLDDSHGGSSINVHQLPSGATAISRTTNAGAEYSGRAGHRVYTQNLVVPPDIMARFAYQPFAILNAAMLDGRMEEHQRVPRQLSGFRLLGRASAIDRRAIEHVTQEIGADQLAALADLSMYWSTFGLIGRVSAKKLFSALISCVPIERRNGFSFTTGLRFSTQRPYGWISLPNNDYELRQVERLSQMRIIDPFKDDIGCQVPEQDYFPVLEALLREKDFAGIEELVDPKRRALRSRAYTDAGAGTTPS